MKHILLIIATVLCCLGVSGQNPAVQSALKSKYSLVQYHPECGGWYFLSYQKGNQTLYGFADNSGNIVASDALKYQLHKGFIELYLLDAQKKAAHDQWIIDRKQYEVDYQNYLKVEKSYEAQMEAYNAKVAAARVDAENRWRYAQKQARSKAQAQVEIEQRKRAQQSSGGGWLGAIAGALGGVSDALTVENAVNAVKFEPFFNEVKAERDLTVPPSKPYNPIPTEPTEPSDGYYWENYCLIQPCPYDYIDYEKIKEPDGLAEVRKDNLHGMVNVSMGVVVPCDNRRPLEPVWFSNDRCRIKTNGGYGVIDGKGKTVLPNEYASIEKDGNSRYIVKKGNLYGLMSVAGAPIMPCEFESIKNSNGYLLCKREGLWGIYTGSFEELYPCQYQNVEFCSINGRLALLTKLKGLWGVIDFKNGQPLLPNNYTSIEPYALTKTESVFKVVKDAKCGLYSDKGVVILPCDFNSVALETSIVGSSYLVADQDGTKGLFTIQGFPIIRPGHYTGFNYRNTYFEVQDASGHLGALTLFGYELIPCKYKTLEFNTTLNGFMAQDDNGSKGILSVTGDEMFPFVQCASLQYSPGADYLTVRGTEYGKTYGALDFDGNLIVPMKNELKKLYKKVDGVRKKNPGMQSAKDTKLQMLALSNTKMNQMNQEILSRRSTFSYFAQHYVERVVNDWQRRGEFEKKEAWEKRVNAETRKQKVFELTKEAQKAYVENRSKLLPQDKIRIVGQYDPDNETYRLKSLYANRDLLIHVPTDDAEEFKTRFDAMDKKATFFVENDGLGLAEYAFFMENGKQYKYSNSASLTYTIAHVDYNFDAIQIDASASNNNHKGGKQTISTTSLSIGTSDVDVAIPHASSQQPNTFALIIANENYSNEKDVEFAYNDGQVFRDYCVKAMGIPENNVQFRANASLNDMRFDFNWLKQTAAAYNGDARFVVYYAGHGMPDDSTRDAYLLPVDGFSSDVKSGYKLSDFYDMLAELPAENVTVFLDACFSGSQRDGNVMASARGVAITPSLSQPKGNMVVFSATTGKETAHPYKGKQHGLFTYFLLKKMKEADGDLTLGDLTSYVSNNVKKVSIVENKKSQTPTVNAAPSLASVWKEIRVK